MAFMDGLMKGINFVASAASVVIGLYALLFIGTLVLGVISNTAQSGDVNVSGEFDTTPNNDSQNKSTGIASTILDVETDYTQIVDDLTSPVGVVLSLVIVAVLMAVFFPGGFFGGSKGGGRREGGGIV